VIAAVTGGTGFIGGRLVAHLLSRGHAVRVLSRRPAGASGLPEGAAFVPGDLTSESCDLRPLVDGVDVLFHCAGEIADPARMRDLHVGGTERLVAAASRIVGRWVQLSSTGAYGLVRRGVVAEESAERPANPYEVTKAESDRLVTRAAERGSFAAAILRPSIVYGPTMPNQSLRQLVRMIEKGLFFFVGPPGASANYIHVDNVVDALLRCATRPEAAGRTYILSDRRTMEELVAIVATEAGRAPPRLRLPEAPVRALASLLGRVRGFPLTAPRVDALTGRAVYSTARIERELGYAHTVPFEDGMRQMVRA
jgi:nucleoside-diphosphate-sugar epimerase